MTKAVVVLFALLAAPAIAHAQPSSELDRVFEGFCAAQGSANPMCKGDPRDTGAYKWLLLDDVCDRDGSPAYCSQFAAVRARTEPCVVAYSHRRGSWRPRHLLQRREHWAFHTDVNGTPTIVVSRSDRCTAIIEETRPLIYGVQLGTVEEKATALFGGLKDLAELLGTTVQATAGLLGPFRMSSGATVNRAIGEVVDQKKQTATPFDKLAAASVALAASLLPLSDLESEVIAALNAAEASETGALTPVVWSRARLDASFWHGEFEQLRASRIAAVASLEGQSPDADQRKVLDQAQKVLESQSAIAEAIGSLAIVRERWDQFVIGPRMLTWMVVPLRSQPIRWSMDQLHAFKIAVETPFAGEVATRLPKVDVSLRLTSPRASMFGVGAGLIITPLEQVTYKAVAGSDGVRRITATDRDSRTGQLALFLDWRLVQAWHPAASTWIARPALQGGVAIDKDTPGFFVGGSIELTRWIRVSAGRTWQSVRVLDDQRADDPVENDAAIRLRDRFEGARYVSVSFAIDELPIFGGK